jgi:hypothetical protein
MILEVRNETKKEIFVKLCRSSLSGNLYLHVNDKKDKHIDIPVSANYYTIIQDEEVKI